MKNQFLTPPLNNVITRNLRLLYLFKIVGRQLITVLMLLILIYPKAASQVEECGMTAEELLQD